MKELEINGESQKNALTCVCKSVLEETNSNTVKEKRRRSPDKYAGKSARKKFFFSHFRLQDAVFFNSFSTQPMLRWSADFQAVRHLPRSEATVRSSISLVLLFTGLSVGANVLIARYIGQNDRKRFSEAVNTVITLSLICGFLLLILGQVIAAPLLRLMNTPDDVIDLAATCHNLLYGYAVCNALQLWFGNLRSVGDTSRPLYCLVISGIVNVLLNLFFVIVCDMSVTKSALQQ